jgi:heterotetrameric sarcosine oxidase delta subunit
MKRVRAPNPTCIDGYSVRIPCPFCGERDLTEFAYFGDAGYVRPDPADIDAGRRFVQALYLRDNPAGPHQELWYHSSGCRTWLRVTRDTRTHEISAAEYANPAVGT